MMAAAGECHLESLILWDPVVNGKKYLEGIQLLQEEAFRFRRKPNYGWKSTRAVEVFGFEWPPFLRAELEKIDLLESTQKPAKNMLLVQTDEEAGDALNNHLRQVEACVEFQRLEAPPIWLPTADGGLLVPGRLLQSLVSWISRTLA
jgi:hypothetical protein